MLTWITLYLLWAELHLHNELPQISRCVSTFYSPTTGLYLEPLTVLLALSIEQCLIEIAVVIENQYLQHVHNFSTYHCVAIMMQSQHFSNSFVLPFYCILIYVSKLHQW